MDRMDATLVCAPIPCLSPLSGTVRPATAAAAMEDSWRALHRKPNRRWNYGPSQAHGLQGPGQVVSLSDAARQHVSTIGKTTEAPYRRAITPQEKAEIEKRLSKQVEVLSKVLQESQSKTAGQHRTAANACGNVPRVGTADSSISKPRTPHQVLQSIKEMLRSSSRPGSSMSVQDLSLPRPSSKLARIRGPPEPGAVASSWSGPLTDGSAAAQAGYYPGAAGSLPPTPGSAPRTPKRFGSRSGLRASAPGPLGTPYNHSSSGGVGGGGAETWVNPLTRPGASEEQRERALLRSSMGNAAAAHTTGTQASATAAASATARLLINRAPIPGALPSQGMVTSLLSRPATAGPTMHGEGTVPQELVQSLLAKPLGAPGNPRWGPGQPLQQFVPTRGLVYAVFSELDPGDIGKLTYSQFEEACVLCGLKREQCKKLFDTLDPQRRGYFTMKEWGAKEHEHEVAEFTRLYIHTTRGASGRPLDVREMKSVSLAVQVALHRLQIKNHGRVVAADKLMHAFEFMDTDGSGALSLGEVQDGFNAMGIYITPNVLHEIMEKFDSNKNGVIEYREFLGALYPVLSKAM